MQIISYKRSTVNTEFLWNFKPSLIRFQISKVAAAASQTLVYTQEGMSTLAPAQYIAPASTTTLHQVTYSSGTAQFKSMVKNSQHPYLPQLLLLQKVGEGGLE